jgi:molecular chaperone GrpE
MNDALHAYTELASVQSGRGRAVIRTAPLDRATATFQRLVSEVVDDQLSEMLPPIVNLRNEFAQQAAVANADDAMGADFCRHAAETMDHVLATAGVRAFEAREGEAYDPLIHLAMGEGYRADLPDGVVAEVLQPGFRSSRGKVIVSAKVKVNRR